MTTTRGTAGVLTFGQVAAVKWAAAECERQQSGEMSVYWMLQGWQYARAASLSEIPIGETVIKTLGQLVEPKKNQGGYRQVGWSVKGPWQNVPRQMGLLVGAVGTIDPDEWYREFEEIHPFIDGNGRVGTLLWNWLKGTLGNPEVPPNFWAYDAEQPLSASTYKAVTGHSLTERDDFRW